MNLDKAIKHHNYFIKIVHNLELCRRILPTKERILSNPKCWNEKDHKDTQ